MTSTYFVDMLSFSSSLLLLKLQYSTSAAHYVGYVEDEESVEAIMRKFEELERLQQELSLGKEGPVGSGEKETPMDSDGNDAMVDGPTPQSIEPPMEPSEDGPMDSGHAGLTEEQLVEVFRRTSSFTLRSALTRSMVEDADLAWELNVLNEEMDAEFIPEQGVVEDDEDEDYFDDEWPMSSGNGKRRPSSGGARRRLLNRQALLERYREIRVQDQAGNVYTLKKKTHLLDPSLPTYSRLPPPPIPASWARRIVPLEEQDIPLSSPGSNIISIHQVISLDFAQLPRTYQAIYADPPLLLDGEPKHPSKLSLEDFVSARRDEYQMGPCRGNKGK